MLHKILVLLAILIAIVVVGCATCHGDTSRVAEAYAGEDVPLSGGFRWDIPPGQFYSPNLTPETGRRGSMSEDDLRAAYRYLKSVPAVGRDVGLPVVNVKR